MKLHIPDQIPPGKDAFSNHPRDIKKWLSNLPQANMGDLTRQVFTRLRDFNRQTMPSKNRMEILELMRPQARGIFDYLKKYFVNRTLPLPDKSKKIITLNQSLLQEIIFGYKIMVYDAANGSDTRIDNKMQAMAICRAIRYMSELLLRASVIYDRPPASTWIDMHRMYAYAREKNINTISVPDIEHPGKKATIESYYKQALLFALARPTAMRQSDSERVYRKLAEWEQLTSLSTDEHVNQINRFFCVRLEQDRPPSYLTQQDCDSDQPALILDTSALVDSIRMDISQSTQKPGDITVGDQISVETLKVLSMSWGICPKRRFSRADKKGHIEAAIGLVHASQAVRNEGNKSTRKGTPRPIPKKETPNFTLQSIPDDMRASSDNISSGYMTHHEIGKNDDNAWDNVAKGRALTDTYDRERRLLETEKLKLNKEDADLHWEVVNISAGGYCLRWNSENTSRAQIGELIALREREPDNTFQWRIGVIRWMQFTRDNGLEIGVQVLSPKVISARAQRHNKPNEQPFDCLMLPGIRPLKQGPSVIMPAHAFKPGDRLSVNVLGQDMSIKLTETREHTGSFTQFQFANYEAATRQRKEEKKKLSEKNQDDFDEIWSSL